LFNLEGKAGLSGFAKLTAEYTQKGLTHEAEVEGDAGIGVKLVASEQIKSPFLGAIPFGVGNFLTAEHEWEQLLEGIEIKVSVEFPVTKVSPIDFRYSVGPSAEVFAGTTLDLSPHVFLRILDESAAAETAMLSQESVTTALSNASDSPDALDFASLSQLVDEPPVSTRSGIGTDPRVYYRYLLENGSELNGVSDASGRIIEFCAEYRV
jgi:hypothetical protein